MKRTALPTTRFLKSSEEILEALVKHARTADSWYFCVAHARCEDGRQPPWPRLADYFPKLQYAVIGLGQHETDPRVLHEFSRLGKLRVMSPDSTEGKFHANVFAFESKIRFTAIVGGMEMGASDSEGCWEAAVESSCRRKAPFEDAITHFLMGARNAATMVAQDRIDLYERSLRERQPLLERLRTLTESFTEQQFIRACRAAVGKKPGTTEREFLRHVARELKFDSMWGELRTRLEDHLRLGVARQVITIQDGRVHVKSATISDYSRTQLVQCLIETIEPGTPVERDTLLDHVRRHLGFPRTSKLIRERVKSAINSAVRQGKLQRVDAKRVMRIG